VTSGLSGLPPQAESRAAKMSNINKDHFGAVLIFLAKVKY
jgi:hypothetical protein